MSNTETTIARLVARKVKGGANPQEAATELAKAIAEAGSADNLAASLLFLGYATEAAAIRAARILLPAAAKPTTR